MSKPSTAVTESLKRQEESYNIEENEILNEISDLHEKIKSLEDKLTEIRRARENIAKQLNSKTEIPMSNLNVFFKKTYCFKV